MTEKFERPSENIDRPVDHKITNLPDQKGDLDAIEGIMNKPIFPDYEEYGKKHEELIKPGKLAESEEEIKFTVEPDAQDLLNEWGAVLSKEELKLGADNGSIMFTDPEIEYVSMKSKGRHQLEVVVSYEAVKGLNGNLEVPQARIVIEKGVIKSNNKFRIPYMISR